MTPRNVRARRIRLGLTVEQLAREFHVSPRVLAAFEAGDGELNDPEKYRPILDRLERDLQRRQP